MMAELRVELYMGARTYKDPMILPRNQNIQQSVSLSREPVLFNTKLPRSWPIATTRKTGLAPSTQKFVHHASLSRGNLVAVDERGVAMPSARVQFASLCCSMKLVAMMWGNKPFRHGNGKPRTAEMVIWNRRASWGFMIKISLVHFFVFVIIKCCERIGESLLLCGVAGWRASGGNGSRHVQVSTDDKTCAWEKPEIFRRDGNVRKREKNGFGRSERYSKPRYGKTSEVNALRVQSRVYVFTSFDWGFWPGMRLSLLWNFF